VIARTAAGQYFSLVKSAGQPKLMLAEDDFKELIPRSRSRRKPAPTPGRARRGGNASGR
jgi:hypothetical protein